MELKALKFSKRRVLFLFIDKIKLYKFYGGCLLIVVCAFALIFTPLRLPASRWLHTRLILSNANLVTELKALKFSSRRVFFVFIDKIKL